MTCILVTAFSLTFGLPAAETFEDLTWVPTFTEPADLKISRSTLAVLTHSSRIFDPLGETAAAVRCVVANMKKARLPVLYLHDKYNAKNPAWMYLYDDWEPTAFVPSDVGHIEANFSQVEHLVCLGGYFEQCEKSTVRDAIRLWYRDGVCHDFRITQITDGVFTVGQHLRFEDSYYEVVRDFKRAELQSRHAKAVMSVDQIVSRIADPADTVEFLQRYLPGVPADVNVVMDVFGRLSLLQIVDADAPVLTFAYRRSGNFLQFDVPQVDWEQPPKSWRNRIHSATMLNP